MTGFWARMAAGFAGFSILAAFAAAGPFGARKIEAAVEIAATRQLAAHGHSSITVRAEGRKVLLRGVAPDEAARARVAALVAGLAATADVDVQGVEIAAAPVGEALEREIIAAPQAEVQACQTSVTRALAGRRLTFGADSDSLQGPDLALLDDVAGALSLPACAGLMLTIEGHTDAAGGEAVNLRLSARRASAVRQRLAQHPLRVRMIERAYGETRPVASNSSIEGRAANRRIDFVITEPSGESE